MLPFRGAGLVLRGRINVDFLVLLDERTHLCDLVISLIFHDVKINK